MKLDMHQRRATEKREPLRTLAEMAQEFGISPSALRACIARATQLGIPQPEAQFGGSTNSQRQSYYRPSVVRKWYTDYMAAQK